MANQFYKTYSDLPSWAKGVLFVGGALVLVGLGFTVKNYIKRKSAESRGRGAVSGSGSTLRDLAKNGIFPKYTDMQYKSWADALFTAMNGYGSGTQQIYDVMKQMQNDADIVKLIQAYDVRTLSSGAYNPSPDLTGNLVMALNDELDSNELFVVNGILAKKNIKYRF
jgi:hypothetical protein